MTFTQPSLSWTGKILTWAEDARRERHRIHFRCIYLTFVSLELRIPSMKLLTSVTPDLVSAMPLVKSSTLVLVASTSDASVSFLARRAITFSVSLCRNWFSRLWLCLKTRLDFEHIAPVCALQAQLVLTSPIHEAWSLPSPFCREWIMNWESPAII